MNEEQIISKLVLSIDEELKGVNKDLYYAVISGIHSEMDDRLRAHEEEENEAEKRE